MGIPHNWPRRIEVLFCHAATMSKSIRGPGEIAPKWFVQNRRYQIASVQNIWNLSFTRWNHGIISLIYFAYMAIPCVKKIVRYPQFVLWKKLQQKQLHGHSNIFIMEEKWDYGDQIRWSTCSPLKLDSDKHIGCNLSKSIVPNWCSLTWHCPHPTSSSKSLCKLSVPIVGC